MDGFTQLVPPHPPQVSVNSTPKDCPSNGFNYPKFRLLNKQYRVRLSSKAYERQPNTLYVLLAVANTKSWFAAVILQEDGTFALIVSPLSDLRVAIKSAKEGATFTPKRTVSLNLQRPTIVTFACSETRLVVAFEGGELIVYDTAALLTAGTDAVTPLSALPASSGPVRILAPNPGPEPSNSEIFAAVHANNTVVLYNSKLEIQGGWISKHPNSNYTPVAVAWSPKGKHIAIGLQGGDILTYPLTNKSAIHKHIPPTNRSPLVSLDWLSPGHTFRTTYGGQETDFVQHIICAESKAPTATFYAPNYPFSLSERPIQAYIVALPKWDEDVGATESKSLVVVADHASTDIEILGSTGTQWYQESQEEPKSLPLDDNQNDTLPFALTLDLTDAEGGVPILYVYLSDGTIQAWTLEHTKPYLGMTTSQTMTSTAPSAAPSPPASAINPPTQTPSAFSQASTFGQSAFGQPSAFGGQQQTSPAFGTSGFGQSPTAAAIGKPSVFGQTSQPTSSFSQLQAQSSPFGQPANPSVFGAGSGAFGGASSSAFGGGSSTSAFGGASGAFNGASTNPFGAPSGAFGGGSSNGNPFGGGSTTNVFGGPSFGATAPTNSFGGNAFSALTSSSTTHNAFGQGSFGASSSTASTATAATASTNSFGGNAFSALTSSSTTHNAFGQGSFGTPNSTASTAAASAPALEMTREESMADDAPSLGGMGLGAPNDPSQPVKSGGIFGSFTSPSTTPAPATSAFGIIKPASGAFIHYSSDGTTPVQKTTDDSTNSTLIKPASGFGQSSFGMSNFGQQPAFGQSSFGKPSAPQTTMTGGGGFSAFASAAPTSLTAAAAQQSGSSSSGGFGAFASSTPSAFGSAAIATSLASGVRAATQETSTSPFSAASPTASSPFGSGISGSGSAFGVPSFGASPFGPQPGVRSGSPSENDKAATPKLPAKPAGLADSPPSSPDATPRITKASIVSDNDSPPAPTPFNNSTTPASSPFGRPTGPTTGAFANLVSTPSVFKPATGFGAFGSDVTPTSSPFFKAQAKTSTESALPPAFATPLSSSVTTTTSSTPAFGAASALGPVRSAFPIVSSSPIPTKIPIAGGFGAFSGTSSGFTAFAGPKKAFNELLKVGDNDTTDPVKLTTGPASSTEKPKPISAFPIIDQSGTASVFSPPLKDAEEKEDASPSSSSSKGKGIERGELMEEPSYGNLSLLSDASSFAEIDNEDSDDHGVRSESDDAEGEEEPFLSDDAEAVGVDDDDDRSISSEESSELSYVPEEEEEEGEEEGEEERVDGEEEEAKEEKQEKQEEVEEQGEQEQEQEEEEENRQEGQELSSANLDPAAVPLPHSRSPSATPQPEVPTVKITPSPPPEPSPPQADSTTPPNTPPKEAAAPLLKTVAIPPSTAPSTPFGLGLGRPSTRPTRSSPLANSALSLADDDESPPSPEKHLASPQPRVAILPIKDEPSEGDASSSKPTRPKTPPLLSAFAPLKSDAMPVVPSTSTITPANSLSATPSTPAAPQFSLLVKHKPTTPATSADNKTASTVTAVPTPPPSAGGESSLKPMANAPLPKPISGLNLSTAPPPTGFGLFGPPPDLTGFGMKGKTTAVPSQSLNPAMVPTVAPTAPPSFFGKAFTLPVDSNKASPLPGSSLSGVGLTTTPSPFSGFDLKNHATPTPVPSPPATATPPTLNLASFSLKGSPAVTTPPTSSNPPSAPSITPPAPLIVTQFELPTEAGLQRESVVVYKAAHDDLDAIREIVEQRMIILGKILASKKVQRTPADFVNSGKWLNAAGPQMQKALLTFEKDLDGLRDGRNALRFSLKEIQSNVLKAKTRQEEITRFNRAKNDKEFAKMLKARSLGPELLETQAQLRRSIRTIRDRVQTLEDHLKGSKRKLAEVKTGRPSIRPPSIDSINRTYRNINTSIKYQSAEVALLKKRYAKLRAVSSQLSTSGPSSSPSPGPQRDPRLPDLPVRRRAAVTPDIAATTAAALNAERAAHRLKRALLQTRLEPLLNTTVYLAPAPPVSFELLNTELAMFPHQWQVYERGQPTRRGASAGSRKHDTVQLRKTGAVQAQPFSWGDIPPAATMKSTALVEPVPIRPP